VSCFESREMFDKWQAQRWWGENYDKIVELYNVQRFNRQALQTPARSDDQVNTYILRSLSLSSEQDLYESCLLSQRG